MRNEVGQIVEILMWRSKAGVSDEEMILAVNEMASDLTKLPGFINQSLYKNSENKWVDIYYWETEKNAHDSNASMDGKETLKKLIDLIEPNSISIEVMPQLQSSVGEKA